MIQLLANLIVLTALGGAFAVVALVVVKVVLSFGASVAVARASPEPVKVCAWCGHQLSTVVCDYCGADNR